MPLPAPNTDAARLAPYAGDIRTAATEAGLAPSLLAGVGLRETLLGWAPGYYPRGTHLGWGDSGNAWGLWQADRRSWKAWTLSPDALTVLGQARQAAMEIAANLRVLRLALPGQPGDLLQRAAVAAYNAPLGAVAAQLLSGRDLDGPTTRGDYSADVYRRAEAIERAGLIK